MSFFSRLFTKKLKCPDGLDPIFWQALYVDRKCPDCGSTDFFMGLQGGLAQNVMCANENCGSKFNLAIFEDGTWYGAPFMIDRISDPSPKKKLEGISENNGGNSLGEEL